MSQQTPLSGFPGMEAEFTLSDGRIISAGELIAEHALKVFHEANPGLDVSQLPLAWNALGDAERQGYCIQAFDQLDSQVQAGAADVDRINLEQVTAPKAEKQLGNALLDVIVEALRDLPRPWVSMTEDQQDEMLERVTKRTREAVKDTIRILATRGTHHVVATVEQITVKKGAKVVLTVPNKLVDEHLLESVGEPVILVLAGELAEADEIEKPAPQPDQPDLLAAAGIAGGEQLNGGEGQADNGLANHSDPED